MKKREITIPTLVGLFITVAGLVAGLWLVKNKTGERAIADEETTPRNVGITNISDTGFTVSWTTNKADTGFVQYSEARGGTEMVAADERDQESSSIQAYFTHYVQIKNLAAETNYKFKIGSGKKLYDLNGEYYQAKTAPRLPGVPTADVAYGQITTQNGNPAEGAIVYVQLPGTVLQSGLVKNSGSWVVPLSTARATNLSEYAKYDPKTEKLEIEVVPGGEELSTRIISDTGSDSPVPNIVLGKEQSTDTGSSEELSVLAPQQGEKVNSAKPEIFGKAPPGANVIIEVHSDEAIKGSTTADSNGNFSFSVPTDLEPGEHTLTVSTVINGVTKSITKKFTVYAVGESTVPAFSATPSGQLAAPTLKPSATPKPTLKPTPTPTLKPLAINNISPTPTLRPTAIPVLPTQTPTLVPTAKLLPSPTPVTEIEKSGETSLTILVLMAAGVLIITGTWWYRKT